MLDWVESNDFLEEVEAVISIWGVGEVGERGISWPGDDGDNGNADDDGALHAVQHKVSSKNTAAEDTNPELGSH